jgi:hypothetical protein
MNDRDFLESWPQRFRIALKGNRASHNEAAPVSSAEGASTDRTSSGDCTIPQREQIPHLSEEVVPVCPVTDSTAQTLGGLAQISPEITTSALTAAESMVEFPRLGSPHHVLLPTELSESNDFATETTSDIESPSTPVRLDSPPKRQKSKRKYDLVSPKRYDRITRAKAAALEGM